MWLCEFLGFPKKRCRSVRMLFDVLYDECKLKHSSVFSELHQTQPIAQQVLHQGAASEGRTREGRLLEDRPSVR